MYWNTRKPFYDRNGIYVIGCVGGDRENYDRIFFYMLIPEFQNVTFIYCVAVTHYKYVSLIMICNLFRWDSST